MERLLHVATGSVLQNHPRMRRQSDTHVPARRMVRTRVGCSSLQRCAPRHPQKSTGLRASCEGDRDSFKRCRRLQSSHRWSGDWRGFLLSSFFYVHHFAVATHICSLSLSEPVTPSCCRFRCLWLAPAPLSSMNLPRLWLAL